MKNNGEICDDNTCKDINMYSFPLQSDKNVYFKDYNGQIFTMNIDKSYLRTRYALEYYTSDYGINNDYER